MQIKIGISLGLLLLSLGLPATEAGKYLTTQPSELTPCHLGDPSFESCFTKNMQTIFITWNNGPPGSNNLGPFDPLTIKRLKISQAGNNVITINADFKNLVVKGASQAVVKKATYDPDRGLVKGLLSIPKLRFEFDYKLKGHVLLLNLNGQGNGFFETEKITTLVEVVVKPRITPDASFSDVQSSKVTFPEIGGFRIKLNNLFGNDKQLEETAHTIFNENWRQFYDILQPAIEQAIQAVMLDRANKIFSYVPANFIIENYH
ncbi:uncharacterized protein LOC132786111 [Drosophila nasuta]|uniref:uncharacterized protein LOC132786111 n=1 Tax=Drosophila nasuta TaxID=42062 RepID=UPI00295F361F|nr:uncharacterized protein LOC132786111 [Drosophila nasuta]